MAARLLNRVFFRSSIIRALPSIRHASTAPRTLILPTLRYKCQEDHSKIGFIVQRFSSGGAELTGQQVEERLINILKLFDKVQPEKVPFSCTYL